MNEDSFDYEAMTEYYLNVIHEISQIIYNTKQEYGEDTDEYKEIDNSYLYEWYTSKEKASYRLSPILDMKDYYTNDDFQYYALEKCSEARHRIQSYLEKATPLLDFKNIDYKRYDSIVMDYYQPLRLSDDETIQKNRNQSFYKYDKIEYRRCMINLGLIEEIKTVKNAIKDSQDLTPQEKEHEYQILKQIQDLTQQLNGYKEDYYEV